MAEYATVPRKIERCEHLHWFLHYGESAMGLRSSFGPMVDLALGGFGGGAPDPHATAARRHDRRIADDTEMSYGRRLRDRWRRLTPDTQRILWLAHGPHAWSRWSKDVARALGSLSGVAILTTAADRGWRASAKGTVGDWLASQASRHRDLRMVEDEALTMVHIAFFEWKATDAPKPRRMRPPRPHVDPLPPRSGVRLIDPEAD